MYFFDLFIGMILAYLAGSINFAILVTRWARGVDIRTLGNRNPGTSNVGREVGKGWAALVFLGDLAKGLGPLILARHFFFTDEQGAHYLALFLTGAMAITGHCWPVWHRFTGGGGLATSIGVFMFFIPVEYFVCMLAGTILVQLFFRKKKYPVGQITPIVFTALTPVLILSGNLYPEVQITEKLSIGGHPWYVITGVVVLCVYLGIINVRILQSRLPVNESS